MADRDEAGCPPRERLEAFAAGVPADAALAAHLARCSACRAELVARDASALFGLLGALPPTIEVGAPPRIAELERRSARRRARRLAAGAAAACAAAAAVWFGIGRVEFGIGRVESPAPRVVARGEAPPASAAVRGPAPLPVVESVDAPGARIVALVPPEGEGLTVTLVLDALEERR
ncbi:MAG: hypothetical protein ABFD84_13455 [Candidatus Polarisedimenticolia bacterium]